WIEKNDCVLRPPAFLPIGRESPDVWAALNDLIKLRYFLLFSSSVNEAPQRGQISLAGFSGDFVTPLRCGTQLAATCPNIWHCSHPIILFIVLPFLRSR
ncbi:MAG: hypothetical protein U1F55_13440, partial [Chitinivorax sp.]